MKMPIVAMLIAIGTALPAPARSQVNVNVNIGQPPVVVAQPVLVPVQASPHEVPRRARRDAVAPSARAPPAERSW